MKPPRRAGRWRRPRGGETVDGPVLGTAVIRAVPFASAAAWANVVLPGSGSAAGPLVVVLLWLAAVSVAVAGLTGGWRTDNRTWLAQRTVLLTWRTVRLERLTEMKRSRLTTASSALVWSVVLDTDGNWIRINDRRGWGPGFERVLGAALKERGWTKALQVDEDSYPLYQFLSGDRRGYVRHLQTLHETGRKLIDPRSGIPTHWFGSPAAPAPPPGPKAGETTR